MAGNRLRGLVPALIFLAIAAACAFAFAQFSAIKNRTQARLPDYGSVPGFKLVSQKDQPFGLEDLKDKVWVANFVFTTCRGPCPLITSRMAELQQKLNKTDDVRLVSFTVDPENDTPPVLAEYASRTHANPEVWTFVTGPKEQVDNLVVKGLFQPIIANEGEEIVHSQRFVVVDGDGRMRSFRDGSDPEVVQKLLMDIGSILREGRG